MTFYAQHQGGAVKSLVIYPLGERIANAPVAYAKYIAKMILPSHLAVLYPYQGSSSWWIIAGACVLLASITPDYAIGVQVTSFVGREKRKVLSQSPRNHALRFIASDSFKIR